MPSGQYVYKSLQAWWVAWDTLSAGKSEVAPAGMCAEEGALNGKGFPHTGAVGGQGMGQRRRKDGSLVLRAWDPAALSGAKVKSSSVLWPLYQGQVQGDQTLQEPKAKGNDTGEKKKNLSRGKAFTAMIKIILKRLAIPCNKKKKKITWRKVRLQAKSEDKKVWKRWILFHTKDQYSSFRKYSHM